jgi:hypothetical protein
MKIVKNYLPQLDKLKLATLGSNHTKAGKSTQKSHQERIEHNGIYTRTITLRR